MPQSDFIESSGTVKSLIIFIFLNRVSHSHQYVFLHTFADDPTDSQVL